MRSDHDLRPLWALLSAGLTACGAGCAVSSPEFAAAGPLAPGAAAGYGVTREVVAESAPPIRRASYQEAADGPADPEASDDGAGPLAAPAPLPVDAEVGADVPDDGPLGGLTLAELEAAALANNPTLRGAAAAVEKARGIHTQVGLYPNPTVGLMTEDVGEDGSAGQHGVFASQTFVTADKLRLNRAVESWEVEGLRHRTEAQRLRVLNGVRRQFFVALGAQRRLELAEELVSLAEEGLSAAEDLFAAEQVARPDVLQVRIQLGEVRIERRDAELDFEGAWRRLVALAGLPDRPVGRLDGELEGPVEGHEFDAPFDERYADLLAASPELAAARARVSRARAAVCRQRAQPVPNVLTQASLAYGFGGDEPIGGLQVGLPLPIFNDNRGNVAAAVADLHRAAAEANRLELSLRARLADAVRDYRRATNRVERLSEDVLPAARENLDLTEEGYRAGEFDVVRVFTARRSLFEAELARVAALTDARAADVALDGLLLTDALGEIPDAGGDNLQGVGLRDLTLGQQ